MFDRTILVYCIVVLAIFSFFQGMAIMAGGTQVQNASGLRRRTLADGFSPWLAEMVVTQPVRDFEALIASSGIRASAARVLMSMSAVTIIVLIAMHLAGYRSVFCLAGGLMLGVAVPLVVIHRLRQRRVVALIGQLPDALDMLVRSLRAGHPVPVGISMVGNELPDPIGGEFKLVFDSMSYGLDLKDALENMSLRLHIPEVKYMVAAIRIQYETGGNLSDVLASLSEVMRERVRLKMKVKAVSAEARYSAAIMAAMPFLLIGGLLILHPSFYKDVPGSRLLQGIMGAAFLLILAGLVLMRRILNIRV
jgi:tight adherence protein B